MNSKRILAFILIFALLATVPALAASSRGKQAAKYALAQLGKPYKLHSDPPHSFNCGSLIMYAFNKVKSGAISSHGIKTPYKRIRSMKNLQVGDIVAFKIASGHTPKILNYHFGIYCGKGRFVHASRGAGTVICTQVRKYNGKYLGAFRLF